MEIVSKRVDENTIMLDVEETEVITGSRISVKDITGSDLMEIDDAAGWLDTYIFILRKCINDMMQGDYDENISGAYAILEDYVGDAQHKVKQIRQALKKKTISNDN